MLTEKRPSWIERTPIAPPHINVPPIGERLKEVSARLAASWSGTWLLYAAAGLVAFLILLVPFYLLVRATTAWETAVNTLLRPATLSVLANTILLTVAVTLSTTALALPLAWLTTYTDLPCRKLWSVVLALPLVIPSYIYAFLFLSFLSPKGLLQQFLEMTFGIERLPSVLGFPGAFIVLTLISYPYAFLTIQASLRQMDTTLLEVAQTYGASKRQMVRYVLWPYLRPSLAAGGLLVALYTLRDFGAVALLQFSTFTRVIYNRYQSFRLDEAATLAVVLVLMTAVILYFEARGRQQKEDEPDEIVAGMHPKQFALKGWRFPALLFVGGVAFMALLMPIGILGYWLLRGLQNDWLVAPVAAAQQNVAPLASLLAPMWDSLTVSLLATAVIVLLALPIALLAVRFRGRWATFFERVTYASYALPGIVVALAFVYIGINYAQSFYQTLPMLVIAYVVLFIPQAVSTDRSTLTCIPRELEEVGYSLGGSKWDIFRYVTLPLMRPGIIAGGLLVFLTAMKELPTMLLLSPLGFNGLSMTVWSNISEAFFARAAAPTLLLLLISSLPLAWLSLRNSQ